MSSLTVSGGEGFSMVSSRYKISAIVTNAGVGGYQAKIQYLCLVVLFT
jgi:hypothetical protein